MKIVYFTYGRRHGSTGLDMCLAEAYIREQNRAKKEQNTIALALYTGR
ncbi:MAG: hypothetical protein U9N46_05275 [Euryarchaeota archaeon]|nr:hypothetical protein [Euryarchaeota archaeon]